MSDFNVDTNYGSGANYLKCSDLQGRRVAVTISDVTLEDNFNKTGKVMVLSFAGKDKKFTLNSTNARMIADLLNQRDAKQWIGKTISLRPDRTQNPQGVMVDCIRVDFELPAQAAYTPQAAPPTQPLEPPMAVNPNEVPF